MWTDVDTRRLLQEILKRKDSFDVPNVRALVWNEIATALNLAGTMANYEQCRAKKKRLNCKFRERVIRKRDMVFIKSYQFINEMCVLLKVDLKSYVSGGLPTVAAPIHSSNIHHGKSSVCYLFLKKKWRSGHKQLLSSAYFLFRCRTP